MSPDPHGCVDWLPLHICLPGPADHTAVNDTDPQQWLELKTTFSLHLFRSTLGPLERVAWVGRPRFPLSAGTFEALDICSQYCSNALKSILLEQHSGR